MQLIRDGPHGIENLFVSPLAADLAAYAPPDPTRGSTRVAAGGRPEMDWNVQMSTEPQRQCSPRWSN
jgi:hypothetical protein